MIFKLENWVQHVLILGAGASADYNLPLWNDLGSLIRKKIDKDKENEYKYKDEILAWIDKTGEGKDYKTLDDCIAKESISDAYPDGDSIENQIFLIIKDIFDELYERDAVGWIRKLNNQILHNGVRLEKRIAFVNYNYDRVLDDFLLNYSYLHKKLKRNNHRERLSELDDVSVGVLYPHGNLYGEKELDSIIHTERNIETMKGHDSTQVDAVSCYESKKHSIVKENLVSSLDLYILGLGGGLEVNLNNLIFKNPLSKIHITARDDKFRDRALAFLSEKYKIPIGEIQTYTSCDDLVEKCFPIL